MSHCVEKLPHSCGSSDGLQVFEEDDKYTGYCFACDKYVPDPYGDNPKPPKAYRPVKTQEEIQAELDEVKGYPTVELPDRKLSAWALEHYGVRIGLSEQDGSTPITSYFPYTDENGSVVGVKTRLLSQKDMWTVGSTKECQLFGWQQAISAGAKRLFITEGEFDAVALFQALTNNSKGGKWANLIPAVVSLRTGAAGAKGNISRQLNEINKNFKEVVLVFDQDEAGRKAVGEVMQILPTAMTATLPCKDANECVIQGRSQALCNAVLFKAEVPKNTRIVCGSTLHEAGRTQAAWGLSWPWKKLTTLTRGIRYGETIYIGAGVKMGKSEIVNAIGAHLITEHGLKIFLAKPEEANRKSYQMILSKIAGKIFHDPNIEFDFAAYDKASREVGDKVMLLNLYQHLGWKTLKADILVAAQQGCKAVFIDPITNLVNGEATGEQNTMLQEIAQELAAMAKDLDIVIFIFCHLKAPLAGEPHERGGKVLSNQFAGSRAMMRSCNLMLGLEGNKDPDLDFEERNMRRLVILEDREFGATGSVDLYWHDKTGLFSEI